MKQHKYAMDKFTKELDHAVDLFQVCRKRQAMCLTSVDHDLLMDIFRFIECIEHGDTVYIQNDSGMRADKLLDAIHSVYLLLDGLSYVPDKNYYWLGKSDYKLFIEKLESMLTLAKQYYEYDIILEN